MPRSPLASRAAKFAAKARERARPAVIGTPKAEASSNYAATISGTADVFDALLTKLEIA